MGETYKDKLQNGKWQEKRLRIIERDGFVCRICKSEAFLEVHHIRYNGDPWQAEDKYLVTLCKKCHGNEHEFKKQKVKQLLEYLDSRQFTWYHIEQLEKLIIYINKDEIEDIKLALAFPPTHKTIIELGQQAKNNLKNG